MPRMPARARKLLKRGKAARGQAIRDALNKWERKCALLRGSRGSPGDRAHRRQEPWRVEQGRQSDLFVPLVQRGQGEDRGKRISEG